MEETKLEFAAGLLASALEGDKEGRESFKNILAVTIQDNLDKRARLESGTVALTKKEIVEVAYESAEDFVQTIENQNNED